MTGKSKATDGALDTLLERLDDAIDGMGHFPDHRDIDRRNGRMTERAGLFLNSIDTLLRDCRSSLAALPPPTGEPNKLVACPHDSNQHEPSKRYKFCRACNSEINACGWRVAAPPQVEPAEWEIAALRAIISECAKALGNGAYIAPTCTVDFMRNLPEEIRLVVLSLRRKVEEQRKALDKALRYIKRGYVNSAGAAVIEAIEAARALAGDRP